MRNSIRGVVCFERPTLAGRSGLFQRVAFVDQSFSRQRQAALAKIIGTAGEQNGQVYKITIGRPDIKVQEMGATINARMGLNTWAAFYGSDADAVVAGDVAMLDYEVQPVLKALRAANINVVAMHHHMIGTSPNVFFLHYWGRGPAQKLAAAVRTVVDQTGKPAR